MWKVNVAFIMESLNELEQFLVMPRLDCTLSVGPNISSLIEILHIIAACHPVQLLLYSREAESCSFSSLLLQRGLESSLVVATALLLCKRALLSHPLQWGITDQLFPMWCGLLLSPLFLNLVRRILIGSGSNYHDISSRMFNEEYIRS